MCVYVCWALHLLTMPTIRSCIVPFASCFHFSRKPRAQWDERMHSIHFHRAPDAMQFATRAHARQLRNFRASYGEWNFLIWCALAFGAPLCYLYTIRRLSSCWEKSWPAAAHIYYVPTSSLKGTCMQFLYWTQPIAHGI